MSTSIAAAANAQATIAATAAREAAHKACEAYVRGFEHDRATVTEMQEYAGCVERLHPEPMSPDALAAVKVVVALLLIGTVAGVVYEWRKPSLSAGPAGAVLIGSVVGLCASAVAVAIFAGVVAGVWFLLK